MTIVIPLHFSPVAAEWESYCNFAVKQLHTSSKNTKAELVWDDVYKAFALSGVPQVEHVTYFEASEEYSDTRNWLLGWAKLTGAPLDTLKILPIAERGEGDHLVLRAMVSGSADQIGVYRICSSLIFNASKLHDHEIELVKSIADRLNS